MSYVRSNFDSLFKSNAREYSDEEVAKMTVSEFDALPLADQISIYHNHRDAYDRLTGQTPTEVEDNKTVTEKAIDEFENLVDDAIARAFHPNGA